MQEQIILAEFKAAKAAGWVVEFYRIGSGPWEAYRVQGRNGKLSKQFTMMKSLLYNDDSLITWVRSCAQQMEYTAVPIPGQVLKPQPFFTGLHY